MNASIASNGEGIYDFGTEKQTHLIMGIWLSSHSERGYQADVRFMHTGPQNPGLENPTPSVTPISRVTSFF
jgi:hypothetical protein